MSKYERYGPEWKKEAMKLRKAELVDMLAKAYIERNTLQESRLLTPDEAVNEHSCPISEEYEVVTERYCSACGFVIEENGQS